MDQHECTTYSKENPCHPNFRCGSVTCYKEFHTPCDDCKPNTYWCEDCFKSHKCSKLDSDIENEAEDETDGADANNSSDVLTYSCPICRTSWAYVRCTDPGNCENCEENNVETESLNKYESYSIIKETMIVDSTKKYSNTSSEQGWCQIKLFSLLEDM